jgi:putative flippase GtrA
MDRVAEFIRKHPTWRWLTRTPFAAKMTKYALSSGIAFVLSYVTFALCYALGMGTTLPTILSFFAAAIPNWIMNRRWAWQHTGRPPVKQTVAYAAVSAMVLFVTAFTTGRTNHWVKVHHIQQHHGLRELIVSGSFVVVTVILFFTKFAIYEFLIFRHDGSRSRGAAGPSSPEAGDDSGREDGSEPKDDSEPPTTWNEAASALPSAHGGT